jgi:C1A family cysteine protease
MKRFRIGSYAAFNIHDNPRALQRIKQYIANGQAVAFSGYVLCGYGLDLPMQDGVIYETSYVIRQNRQPAGHGQLVVGYDDSVGTPGNQGALLIQNSFGTGWPASAGATSSIAPPGMAYWSYNSFEQTQQLAAVAYPRARPASQCEIVGQPLCAARFHHKRVSMGPG